jgi:hypothetical protein
VFVCVGVYRDVRVVRVCDADLKSGIERWHVGEETLEFSFMCVSACVCACACACMCVRMCIYM